VAIQVRRKLIRGAPLQEEPAAAEQAFADYVRVRRPERISCWSAAKLFQGEIRTLPFIAPGVEPTARPSVRCRRKSLAVDRGSAMRIRPIYRPSWNTARLTNTAPSTLALVAFGFFIFFFFYGILP